MLQIHSQICNILIFLFAGRRRQNDKGMNSTKGLSNFGYSHNANLAGLYNTGVRGAQGSQGSHQIPYVPHHQQQQHYDYQGHTDSHTK